MKKIIIIAFAVMLGTLTADSAFPLLSIEEVRENYLQDYELVKTIELEGQGHSSAVAKDTGDMVVVTETPECYMLYYINNEGSITCNKSFNYPFKGNYGFRIYISDNGETFSLIRQFGDIRKTFIYDRDCNELYSILDSDSFYLPSLNGDYITKVPQRISAIGQQGKIFTRSGEEIFFELPEDIEATSIITSFIDDKKFIALIEYKDSELFSQRLVGYDFQGQSIKIKWQRDLNVYIDQDSYNYHIKRDNETFTIKSCEMRAKKTHIFDLNGNYLFEYDGIGSSFAYTQDHDIVINHSQPTELRVITNSTFQERKLGLSISPNFEANFIDNAFKLDKDICLVMYRNPYKLKNPDNLNYQCLFYNAENQKLYSYAPYMMFIENDKENDLIISIDQFSNPIINIFKRYK